MIKKITVRLLFVDTVLKRILLRIGREAFFETTFSTKLSAFFKFF